MQGRRFATENHLRDLLGRGLAGDQAAYQAFLKELSGHLRAYLRKRLAALPDEVEDLVQESLLAVHIKRHTFDPGRPVTAWAYAIAKYKMVDYLRHRAGHEGLDVALDNEGELVADSDHDAVDARRDLTKFLRRLPDRQRLPIVHMKLEGRSVAETAQLTGLSSSAVKVGVHRALKALAVMIRDDR